MDQLTEEYADPKRVRVTLVSDPEYFKSKDKYNSNDRLEDVANEAIRMYSRFKNSGNNPVLCLLGASKDIGSDISRETGMPVISAQKQAQAEMNHLLSTFTFQDLGNT